MSIITYRPPELVEIPRKDGEKITRPGVVTRYKESMAIISEDGGDGCRGCYFSSSTIVGGCPFYFDGGKKIFPCQKNGLIFKKTKI